MRSLPKQLTAARSRILATLATMILVLSTCGVASASEVTHFDVPVSITASGRSVWVANSDGNSITQLNSKSGDVERVIRAKSDQFLDPTSVVYSSGRIWVVNSYGNSITELNANTGSLVRVITSHNSDLDSPYEAIVSNSRVFVLSPNEDSVTELDSNNGKLDRVYKLHSGTTTANTFTGPLSFALHGTQLLITNLTSTIDEVLDLNIISGSVTRLVAMGRARPTSFFGPIVIHGSDAWIVRSGGASISEVKLNSGKIVRTIADKQDDFRGISALGLDGHTLWVTSGEGDSLTRLNAINGTLIGVTALKRGGARMYGPLAFSDSNAWLLDTLGSVFEINGRTGKILRDIR